MRDRYEDWEPRLGAFLRAALSRDFSWGSNDCALFAADAVQAMTGYDPAAAFRGRYKTARGALTALRRRGFADLPSAVSAGFAPVPFPRMLQRGDVAAFAPGPGQGAGFGVGLGIVDLTGKSFVVLSLAGGVEVMPLADAVAGWRV